MNGSLIPAPSLSRVTAQNLHDDYERACTPKVASLEPPPRSGVGTEAILDAADVPPPPINIHAPDSSLFENDLSYAVGTRKAGNTLHLTYPSHLDAENSSSSTTAVQASYNLTGLSSDLSFNTGPSSTAYSLSNCNTNYLTTAPSFDAQIPLHTTWDETYLATPLHQEYVHPTLTNSLASDNIFSELSSNMSYNVGPSSLASVSSENYANAWEVSSSLQTQAGFFPGLYMDPLFDNSISLYDGTYPGTSQLGDLSKLTAPPAIPTLPENDLQTTSCSSIEHSYQPQSSASGSTQISGTAISSSSVTSGIKRRSYSPLANDSENPGPSKRHRTTQYLRTQPDAHPATSGLVGEQNQIIARQITPVLVQGATTSTSSQILSDSGKAPSNNPRTAPKLIELALWPTAELAVANKHIHTLDGSGTNPPNVSSQHIQENRNMGHPNVHATGSFSGASNFAIHNPTMVEQNIYTQSNKPPECLKWLEEHIMKDAELDSFERDPPPRCHPDTRTTLIQQAQDWFNEPPDGKQLLWLRGPAGVGKSAIIQTLAEGWREEQKLGASLFFSRERQHTNPTQVFPSLAYQIATQDPSYAAYISDVMIRNPRSLETAMSEQFRVLFIEPFSRRRIRKGSTRWVITLDGLDECGDNRQKGQHSDTIQQNIVRLISNFTTQNRSVPLLWIIASRSEAHLKAVFAEETIGNSFFDLEVPINSDEAQRDVEKYLVCEFKKIRNRYPDHIGTFPWPENRQFIKIVKVSSGYFAFAAVLIRFIEDPHIGNPVAQLKWVMLAVNKLLQSRKQFNDPLTVLDGLYIKIVSRIPPDVFQVTRQLMGASMYLDRKAMPREDWSLWLICDSLGITRDSAMTALRHLHSVIKLRTKKPGESRPSFYHTSFRDFLQDPGRSLGYSIDLLNAGGDIIQKVATYVVDIICEFRPQGNSCAIALSVSNFKDAISHSLLTSSWRYSPSGIDLRLPFMDLSLSDKHFEQLINKLTSNLSDLWKDWKIFDKTTPQFAELQRRGFIASSTLEALSLDLATCSFREFDTEVVLSTVPRENGQSVQDLSSQHNKRSCPTPEMVIVVPESRSGRDPRGSLKQLCRVPGGSQMPTHSHSGCSRNQLSEPCDG